ncbi:MAG: LysR family transcriptional regulator [Pseudomonadota bacterium]
MIDLNAVAVFIAVVEAGSLTGGARALGLPKGSVSRKVSGLEAALGARLLHRTTRKLSLTAVGRSYYERCKRGLSEIDAANQSLDESRNAPRGVLRISAPIDFGGGGLGDWVPEFLKRYDQTRVELVLSDRYVDLIEQRIDLAFRTGALQDSSFVSRRLGATRRVICASPTYLRQRGEPRTLNDLREHHAVVYGSAVGETVWRLSGPQGELAVAVDALVAVDSMSFVLQAVLSGLGLALLPEAVARTAVDAGRLRRILEDYATASHGVFAVYPSHRQLSPNVRAFLDLVVEMTRRRAPWLTADA